MAFLTGLMLLDCPASALNMSNESPQEAGRDENAVAVKFIRSKAGTFPYVSAQAFRYWLRTTLETAAKDSESGIEWKAAPIRRDPKIAYTDADPIKWSDDDLFGYMRAESGRNAERGDVQLTPISTEITRVSPFRVSTLVSIAPVSITYDYGSMSRHEEGHPVPHGHQFYKALLKGLISLDLRSSGTFSYKDKTGFRNLDEHRRNEAVELKLEHLEVEKSYRLSKEERKKRISSLLKGLGLIYGGAKQALHYTDVMPKILIAMVIKGGNNPLQYTIGADEKGMPVVHREALTEMFNVWGDQILSKLYVGWVRGFFDEQRDAIEETLKGIQGTRNLTAEKMLFKIDHPRVILDTITQEIEDAWLQ